MKPWLLIITLAFILAAPADSAGARSWGPRVGLSSGPDQFVFGAHVDVGEILPGFNLRPHGLLGLGDNFTTLAGAGDLFWRFSPLARGWSPYLGGTVGLLHVRFDDGPRDFTDTDLEILALVGMETQLRGGAGFHVELKLELVDAPDAMILAGWTF